MSTQLLDWVCNYLDHDEEIVVPIKKMWNKWHASHAQPGLAEFTTLILGDKRIEEMEGIDHTEGLEFDSPEELAEYEQEMEEVGFYSGPRVKLLAREITLEHIAGMIKKHNDRMEWALQQAHAVMPDDVDEPEEGQLIDLMAQVEQLRQRLREIGLEPDDDQPGDSHYSLLTQITSTITGWLNQPEPADPHWSPFTWETFQFVCRVHGVAPLLHPTLQAAPWLDDLRKSWLVEQHRFNAQRIARMQAELQAILRLFGQHHLPIIPLKGSLVAVQYYAEAGLRPMADLDLLIQPGDFGAATRLLVQLGYQPEVAHWKHTEFIKPENRTVVSPDCEHPDNPRKLEVHLRCRESFGGPVVDLTGLMWRHASRGELLGETAWLVKPEALWLHLLVHATYHLWQGRGRLIHLVDLAQVTPHLANPPAWLIHVEARYTYPALAMLHCSFPGRLDPALVASQQARVSASFRRWVDSLNLVNTSHLNPNPAGLYLLKALKFSEGRPGEVAQALRFALLPSLAEVALDHPNLAQSKAPWLAYFLLPFDWIKRIAGKV